MGRARRNACRLCMKPVNRGETTTINNLPKTFAHILEEISGLKFTEADGLHMSVCVRCRDFLQAMEHHSQYPRSNKISGAGKKKVRRLMDKGFSAAEAIEKVIAEKRARDLLSGTGLPDQGAVSAPPKPQRIVQNANDIDVTRRRMSGAQRKKVQILMAGGIDRDKARQLILAASRTVVGADQPIQRRTGQRGVVQRATVQRVPSERGTEQVPGHGGSVQRVPGQRGAVQRVLGQRGTVQRVVGQRGAVQRVLVQRGAVQRVPGQRGAVQRVPGQRGAVQRVPGQRGAVQRVPGQRGAAQSVPGQRGAAQNVPGQRGQAQNAAPQNVQPPRVAAQKATAPNGGPPKNANGPVQKTPNQKNLASQKATVATTPQQRRQANSSGGRTLNSDKRLGAYIAPRHNERPAPYNNRGNNRQQNDNFNQQACPLEVGIVPINFPNVQLDDMKLEALKEAITNEIFKIPQGGPLIRFLGTSSQNGWLKLICADELSHNWLSMLVSRWERAGVRMVEGNSLPQPVVLSLYLPGDFRAPDEILYILERQNSSLNTNQWRIINRETDANGQSITVCVDEQSFQALQSRDFMVFLGLGIVEFKPRRFPSDGGSFNNSSMQSAVGNNNNNNRSNSSGGNNSQGYSNDGIGGGGMAKRSNNSGGGGSYQRQGMGQGQGYQRAGYQSQRSW